MAKITKITAQKTKKRVNIYLDDQFAFGLDADNFLKSGLRIGRELSEKEIENLTSKNEFQKILDKVYRFVSLRPRSRKEIEIYLKKKKASPDLVEKIFRKLEKLGYLDDKAFAEWWIEQRSTFRPKGKIALKAELRQKGVDKKLVDELIDGEVDELNMAQKALAKRLKNFKKLPQLEFRQKITTFLSYRGFSYSTIKKIIDSQIFEEDN